MMAATFVVFATLSCALTVLVLPLLLPPSRNRADILRSRIVRQSSRSELPPRAEDLRHDLSSTLTRWGRFTVLLVISPLVSWRRRRRSREFRQQLPDAVLLLCGALRAGLAVRPALESVSADLAGPVGEEWQQALLESQLGLTLDAALIRVAERTQSTEAAWLVELIAINREVGGDLGAVLTTLAETLRERDRQRRHIQALTAEARLSAIILCLLPPGFACYLAVVRPDYVSILFTSPTGLAMVAMAAGLLAVGIMWMRLLVSAQAAP